MTERPISADERDWAVHPGEILREALDERDMTQTDLAALLGVSQAAVSHLVTGTNGIGAATALKLEDALGISARFWLHLQADERAADAR